MINLLKTTLLSLAVVMFSYSSATAVTLPSQAKADVVDPIFISETSELNFGTFDNFTGGTITVGTDDSLSTSGITTHLGFNQRAEFAISGEEDEAYTISVGSSVTLNGSGTAGGSSMSATLVGDSVNGNATSSTLTGGADIVYVGGTLTSALNQAAGPYSGTYNVTVQY